MVGRAELLAQGSFGDVRAAGGAGRAATACAALIGDDGAIGLAWDLARGARVGEPLPGFPCDGEAWAFGVLPGPRGDSPVVAWAGGERVHVHDVRGGGEVVIDDADASFPDVVGLAVHRGRGAVVTVFDRRPHAEIVLWDARTGERLADFETWSGYRRPDHVLHATPESGALIALACAAERAEDADPGRSACVGVLDAELGRQVAELDCGPAREAPMVPWEGGVVLVVAEPGRIVVRSPDGEEVAAADAPEVAGAYADVAAARVDGRLLVAAGDFQKGAYTVRDVARPEPLGRVEVPGPVGGTALAADGTFLAATDAGLYRAHVSGLGT
ncbi:DNA ligase-like domain-containing protein [Actinomadura sediminis]|uniref:WD40 repeat domain-containing protein n=1 Tax=Actinomadura sediminis TaxID=1038904 RepID=A0ABW3EMJ3_9ACTN